MVGMLALGLGLVGSTFAADPNDVERWQQVRKSLFAERPIVEDKGAVLELDTPIRAEDAAVVPIAIRTKHAQSEKQYIKKVYLVIDHNPSPVGAVFSFTPESGRADIETRVRVEEYTYVRAIAEMNDGTLYMRSNFVKASGGCSAPAGKDLEAAMARLGKMKFRIDGDVVPGQPTLAQLMISHPNISGMGMDQLTRLTPPPHFVRQIKVSYQGKPVMTADVDFTISENPNFRFYFLPAAGTGELKADVVDSNELKFESAIAIKPGPQAGS
jgi:sulfur-oxidizing protein SoxY